MMSVFSRQEVLNVLQDGWGTYVPKFRSLPPNSQSVFLTAQGYLRFADLLSHIVAWWEVGFQSIERYLADSEAQPQNYDVDIFNAEAVAKTAGLDESQVIESFENMRLFLINFVKTLPETAFANEKVNRQLSMEFVGHLSEHVIPEREQVA